ncbi:hypothetical protein IMZ38_07220 [Thermosphaera chiliense]|uniref:Uncharacterized protein n=1 Tax=Thermosphaera chiliense TaxID=3402707 RepID=A0A7M1USF5_9CREN|nr:hypothetical protein [Thermosphaera aggregans]QOR94383.1 hypothetical protein IMZ38_07220 [Thermosphaera aggregans]
MSEYMKQFKIQVASKIPGIKFQDKSGGELQLIKDGNVVATIKDEKDYVTVTIKNNTFKYDKWYTKPEHLAETIRVYIERS